MGEELQRFLGMAFLLLHAQEPTANNGKVEERKGKTALKSDAESKEKTAARHGALPDKRCA
jgi:hypothetical protein